MNGNPAPQAVAGYGGYPALAAGYGYPAFAAAAPGYGYPAFAAAAPGYGGSADARWPEPPSPYQAFALAPGYGRYPAMLGMGGRMYGA